MIFLFLFFNCILSFSLQANFKFNNSAQLVVKSGSSLEVTQPININAGEIVIESGATVSGTSDIVLSSASLIDRASSSEKMEGSFVRKFNTSTLVDGINLTGGQKVAINGPVLGDVSVSGLNNVINGSPKFYKSIVLSNSVPTSFQMGIFSDCDVDIELAGGTLSLGHSLKMASGKKISSSTGSATVALNTESLAIGGVSGAWTEAFTFSGGGKLNLYSDLSLKGAWTFNGNTTISSSGSALDISNVDAQIVIGSGTTLELDSINLSGLQNGKLVFTDSTSTLKLSNSNITMSGDFDQNVGSLITSSSTIAIGTHYWKLGSTASFVNAYGELWLDTLESDQPPVFTQAVGLTNVSLVNNSTVKQKVDFQKVTAATNRLLVSGSVSQDVTMQTDLNVNSGSAIVATDNIAINSAGTAINFSKSDSPQLVVDQGKVLSLVGDHTLNIQSNTIFIDQGAILATVGTTTINAADNISIPSGTMKVAQDSVLVINGSSNGDTKFGLSSEPGMPPAKMEVGIGKVELKGINFYNIEQATVEKKVVNGVVVQGEFILSGGAKIHIKEDCKVNFRVRGDNNTLIIHKSGVVFSGTIKFETYDTNVLNIKFELDNEDEPMTLEFGPNAMQLFSSGGFAKLNFLDRDVTVINSNSTSFVTGGHAFLNGESVTISLNPIVQSVSDLGLSSSLLLQNDDTIDNPFVNKSPKEFLQGRSPDFIDEFRFPFLAKHENYFRNNSLIPSRAPVSRPTLRIANTVAGVRKGVIKLFNNSKLTKFTGSAQFDSLELQFTGNGSVLSVPRRQKRTVNPVKSKAPDFEDESYTDNMRKNDRVFVSGTGNRFLVTGNLQFNNQLYLDEQSELIFEFDDSIDTPKAILFRPVDQDGNPYLYLPKSSTIVFNGSGQVVFDPYLQIEFGGDNLVAVNAKNGIFEDNRPSLIFKNYSQMILDQGQQLLFFGKGQMMFQNNSKLDISYGNLSIGNSSSDIFNMTFDRQAILSVGDVQYSGNSTAAIDSSPARLSLAYGSFSLKYLKQSTLMVQNGGLIELMLSNGIYTGAEITEFSLAGQSILNLQNYGRIAIAQPTENLGGSIAHNFYFDNLDSVLQGSGLMTFYTAFSSSPVYEARIQPDRYFKSESISPYDCFKKFAQITASRADISPNPDLLGLEFAVDYTDIDNLYKLRNKQGITTTLINGDTIRREAPGGGIVFGTASSGTNFAILENGSRVNV